MRRAAKTDGNQSDIVKRLREIGVKVYPMHRVGEGFPDLLCWARGRFFLVEVKEPGENLNPNQVDFFAECPGEIYIARTADEAVLAAVGAEAMK